MSHEALHNSAADMSRPVRMPLFVASVLLALAMLVVTKPPTATAQQPSTQKSRAESASRDGNNAQRQAPRRGQQRTDESSPRVRAPRKSADTGELSDQPRRPTRAQFRGFIAFRPAPEDYGPLREGEQEELLRFARRHVPSAYKLLSEVREKDPEAFSKHMQDAAPRLRALRRVFNSSPRLGQMIVQHAENDMAIRRGQRMWRNATPEQRKLIELEWRKRLAGNAKLEARAATQRLAQLDNDRDKLLADDLEALLEADDDLPGETPAIRDLVTAIRNAADDETRQAYKDRLHELLAEQFDQDLAAARERLTQFRENMKNEVDQRLQRTIEQAKNGPARPPTKDSQ